MGFSRKRCVCLVRLFERKKVYRVYDTVRLGAPMTRHKAVNAALLTVHASERGAAAIMNDDRAR